MNAQRVALILTVINAGFLVLLLLVVAQVRPVLDPSVLRARALEIVDDRGRVRASLSVIPEDPSVTFEGHAYPETVLLRLIDPNGRPDVKISATVRGGGLLLGGAADPTYAQILADETTSSIKLTNRVGKEQILRP